MDASIIEAYVDKVYGYAINHTYSRDEADELSQEILFTAVKELPKLRDESKFEPWLWGIASNVTKAFRRYMGKQRSTYSYDTIESLSYEDEYFDDKEEIYGSLRTKIAMMSAIYRDIIVLYYYDGLSVKRIAEKLSIPEGTVTWRLSEGRKKLKKECNEMNETALHPIKLNIGIYGSGDYNGVTIPFPSVYIDDSLSQNILYYCYEKPLTVEDISKLCGVPAYYVEERLDNLLKRRAVIEAVKGKYQTNFIIFTDKYGIFCEENAEKALLPVMDKLAYAIRDIASEADGIDFYRAEKPHNDLLYLYGVMAFSYASYKYCKLPYPALEPNYDGNCWNYLGFKETGKHKRIGIGTQVSANKGSRGTYAHFCYQMGQLGSGWRRMMYDNYINVCEDLLIDGRTEDIDSLSKAIKDDYIVKKDNGSFFVTVPAFNKEQCKKFNSIVEKHLAPIMDEYSEAVTFFVKEYKKLFPKHLDNDVDRMCQGAFVGMYPYVMLYGQKNGIFPKPTSGFICDVITQKE